MTFLKCPECPATEEKRYDTSQLQDHLGTVHLNFFTYKCRLCANTYISHYRALSHMKMKCKVPLDLDMQMYTEPLLHQIGHNMKELNRLVNLAVQNYAREVASLGIEAATQLMAASAEKPKKKKKRERAAVKEEVTVPEEFAPDAASDVLSAFDQSRDTDAVSTVQESEVGEAVPVVEEDTVEAPEFEMAVGEAAAVHEAFGFADDGDRDSMTNRARSHDDSNMTIEVGHPVYYPPASDISSQPSDVIGDDLFSNVSDDTRLYDHEFVPPPAPTRLPVNDKDDLVLPAYYYLPVTDAEEYSVEEMLNRLETDEFPHGMTCTALELKDDWVPCGCDPEDCAWIREVARLVANQRFWTGVEEKHPEKMRRIQIAMGLSDW